MITIICPSCFPLKNKTFALTHIWLILPSLFVWLSTKSRFHLLIVYCAIWPHKKNSNISKLQPLHFITVKKMRLQRCMQFNSISSFKYSLNFGEFLFVYIGNSHHHGQHQSNTSASVHHQQQSPIIDRVTAATPPNLSNLSSDSTYDKFRLLNDHHVSHFQLIPISLTTNRA